MRGTALANEPGGLYVHCNVGDTRPKAMRWWPKPWHFLEMRNRLLKPVFSPLYRLKGTTT